MTPGRRTFLAGLGAAISAPAVIRTPGLLVSVRAIQACTPMIWLADGRLPPSPQAGDIISLRDGSRWIACGDDIAIEWRLAHPDGRLIRTHALA